MQDNKFEIGDDVILTMPLKVLDKRLCEDFAPTIGTYSWWEYLVQYDYLDKSKQIWISEEKLKADV